MLFGIICYSRIGKPQNRTDIQYLTTNTDTEVSTLADLFHVLKNTEYWQLNKNTFHIHSTYIKHGIVQTTLKQRRDESEWQCYISLFL